MKRARHLCVSLVIVASTQLSPDPALAAGAGASGDDAGDGGPIEDASSRDDGGDASTASAAPVACDGALCDTTNGSTCGVARRRCAGAPIEPMSLASTLGALVAAVARRRRAPVKERVR